jgi:hypothetical protein
MVKADRTSTEQCGLSGWLKPHFAFLHHFLVPLRPGATSSFLLISGILANKGHTPKRTYKIQVCLWFSEDPLASHR